MSLRPLEPIEKFGFCIGKHVELLRDLNALARTSRWLFAELNTLLYRLDYVRGDEDGSALCWAAYNGREDTARITLTAVGDSIRVSAYLHHSPIHLAAMNGHARIVELLLSFPLADPEATWPLIGPKPLYRKRMSCVPYKSSLPGLLRTRLTVLNTQQGIRHSPLMLAAKEGHVDVIRVLLAADGIETNLRDKVGRTALANAARLNRLAAVDVLLSHPAVDVNLADRDGKTPLWHAAYNGHESVAKMLLSTPGINCNAKDDGDGYTAIGAAVKRGHLAVIRLLLANPAVDVNEPDNGDQTPLMGVVMREDYAIAEAFVDSPRVDLNQTDDSGDTAIVRAMENLQLDPFDLLLDSKSLDLRRSDGWGGNLFHTFLQQRTRRGNEPSKERKYIIGRLLEREGLDPNRRDKDLHTPLELAMWKGDEMAVRMLLSSPQVDANATTSPRADPRAPTLGFTPLILAAAKNWEAMVRLLLISGRVDVNARNQRGRTALTVACIRGRMEATAVLLGSGKVEVSSYEEGVALLRACDQVDVNAADDWGSTAMHLAVIRNCPGTFGLILDSGRADIDARDHKGRTALWWALERGRDEMAASLLAAGADSTSTHV